jgi:hypothetical protein
VGALLGAADVGRVRRSGGGGAKRGRGSGHSNRDGSCQVESSRAAGPEECLQPGFIPQEGRCLPCPPPADSSGRATDKSRDLAVAMVKEKVSNIPTITAEYIRTNNNC